VPLFGCGFEVLPFGVGEFDVGGFDVLFEVVDGRRAGDGEDDWGAVEQPRQ